jgi:predicted RNase H-like HicB family nuclease
MALIVVTAAWDDEAQVWVAESDDVPGLVTEADTLEALRRKLPGMIADLSEGIAESL